MNKLFKNRNSILILTVSLLVIITSIILGFHNATLYNPSHGFDGTDHVFYINYIAKYKNLPPVDLGSETHQSPLYYIIGALLTSVSGSWKTAQYINTFVLWLIIGMVGLGLWKVFKKTEQVLIGMFSLAALPMLNIFPPMITNELLNTFWIISTIVAIIYLISSKNNKKFFICLIWFTGSFILGMWSKISIILTLPTFFIAFIYILTSRKFDRKLILVSLSIISIIIIGFSMPVFLRTKTSFRGSNMTHYFTQKYTVRQDYQFFYRLDWIPKVDMYNTQYYSLLGGAWNSFWSDGHNAITPFVKFHKKALILWSLGFVLLPISMYGLKCLWRLNRKVSLIINTVGITMLGIYVWTNLNGHYSGVRLTYEMGIVVPYAFGIVGASTSRKVKKLLILLLSVQFITMVSFYWIQPWWHVTR